MSDPIPSKYSAIEVHKQVLMTVWTLANQEVFRSIADRFGFCNRGMAHYCVMNTCRRIRSCMYSNTVTWPSTVECAVTAQEIENRYGFPGAAGCLDGCHVPIKAPAADRDSYVNRKGFTSLNLLAVCDENMKFVFAYSDCPGSMHDARVLQMSQLVEKLSSRTFDTERHHFLGDAAYPLLPGLMVPFRDNG